ncbi:sensor histidine kinase [Runella sp.]|uniref:sensor histidine kinase n=1 Tax=Runella sp. TaxID=1960881 RepID=UPI003D0A204C
MVLRNALLGIFLAMGVSLSMLAFLSWLAHDRIMESNHRTEDVNHTYRVRLKNKDILATMNTIETGERGYLLTVKEKYLQPYGDGRSNLKGILRSMDLLVRDNPRQMQRVKSIKDEISHRLNLIEYNIERARNGYPIDTSKLSEGKMHMDNIRVLCKELDNDERLLLSYRSGLQKNADSSTNFYLFLLSAVSLAFLLVFFRLLYIELRRRIAFQKTLEEKLTDLERANAELEQFAYVASHDLQEPLRKMRAFSERLQMKQGELLNEDGKTNLLKINQSAIRMQQLIDDLLTFSRTANLKERVFEEVNLNTVFREVKEELHETISQKNATIISEVLPTVQGMEFQLFQLFNNLISNAIKYSKPDVPPLIEIDYRKATGSEIPNIGDMQKNNIYHRISFIDNGIGFDPVYAEKIFVIFQRLHNRTEYQGTGIGLALCRRIVTNHNGFIIAEARANQEGSIFHVYLPT